MMPFPRSTIASFALLETATDFVPVPFVGDMLAKKVHEKLVARVGEHYGIPLGAEVAQAFSEDPPAGVFRRVARGASAVVLAPLRVAFAGAFAVLGANAVVDAFGKRYARGLAVDVALGEGVVANDGIVVAATKVVAAVDRVETRPARRLAHLAFHAFERAAPGPAGSLKALATKAEGRFPSLASRKLRVTTDERDELRSAMLGTPVRADVVPGRSAAVPATV